MAIVTQSRVASAPTRRQGFARFAHRLTPPLTAASTPAQRAISCCLTQLLRSFNHWLRHEIPDNSRKLAAIALGGSMAVACTQLLYLPSLQPWSGSVMGMLTCAAM